MDRPQRRREAMITDLGHTAFAAYDVKKTLEFYALLDVREAFRLHHDDGSLMLVYLHIAGDRFLEVFPGGPPPRPRPRAQLYARLPTHRVGIHAVCEHLRTEGVALDREPVVGLDGNWQAWVKDPDGNPIEVMQLSEDSPQRKAARSAGERDG
jgi:lactoylglutathione lyase